MHIRYTGHGQDASARVHVSTCRCIPFSVSLKRLDGFALKFDLQLEVIQFSVLLKLTVGYKCTCARALRTPFSVSRERLDGLRRNLVCGQWISSYALYTGWNIRTSARVAEHTLKHICSPSLVHRPKGVFWCQGLNRKNFLRQDTEITFVRSNYGSMTIPVDPLQVANRVDLDTSGSLVKTNVQIQDPCGYFDKTTYTDLSSYLISGSDTQHRIFRSIFGIQLHV